MNTSITRAGITRFDGSMSGLRQVDSLGSILQVRAGPLSEIKRIKAIRPPFGSISYLIDGQRLYIGRGQEDRKIGDRIRHEARPSDQVYLIFSSDTRFNMRVAADLEAQFVEHADRLSIPLANQKKPYGPDGIEPCADLEQLVQQAHFLLSVAGLRRFEEAEQNKPRRPVRVAASSDLHDVKIVERDAVVIPADAVRKKLMCRGLHAEGVAIDGRFLVLPDADFAHVAKSGLSPKNVGRRDAIAKLGILKPLPDATDRARLDVGLDCKSAALAAKIVSGEHIGTEAWQVHSGPKDPS